MELSNGMTTSTNASGHYAFYDVAIGNYTITATKDGYNVSSYLVSVTQITVASGGTTVDGTMAVSSSNSNGSNDTTMIIVIIAVVIIVAFLAVVMVVHRRNKKT